MSDLINRELICSRSICYDIECDFCRFADADGVCKLRERVYALPTVDAVPVIRCKDCIFCRKYKYREDVCTCLKFGSGRNMYDYCSYAQIKEADFGERRNDDCN